jgi:hypothetical protein
MTHSTVAYRRSFGGRPALTTEPRGARLIEAFGRWLSDWRGHMRRARAESRLRRKLEGYDHHLLRDMGLMFDGYALREIESVWSTRRMDPLCFGRNSRR